MTTFNWIITPINNLLSGVEYQVTAIDGIYQAVSSGIINNSQFVFSNNVIRPGVRHEILVMWVQAYLGKDRVEDNLQAQINTQKV